jgi:GT2 family glycosyltransferase
MIRLQKKVGVLVVTYNQYNLTKEFILHFRSIFQDQMIHLLILDNASEDNTFSKLKNEFPSEDIRSLNNNYGCVTGRNIGIIELIRSGCDYIYISDNDILFEQVDFFVEMLVYMENQKEIDALCPIVLWSDNRSIQTLGGFVTKFQSSNILKISDNKKIERLPGCAQFFRSETFIKHGLFDNDLSPVSIEDFEWGYRNFGKVNLCYYDKVHVLHTHTRFEKNSPSKMRFIIMGRIVLLRKHFSFFFLINEMFTFLHAVGTYGISFTIKAYLKGFRKRIEKNNFSYESFSKINFERFYNR